MHPGIIPHLKAYVFWDVHEAPSWNIGCIRNWPTGKKLFRNSGGFLRSVTVCNNFWKKQMIEYCKEIAPHVFLVFYMLKQMYIRKKNNVLSDCRIKNILSNSACT